MAMARGHLLKIPRYRLMFFNGIIDIIDIVSGSFQTAYFHFTGAVFCSDEVLSWIGGWCEATFNCMVFALNRVIKMMPPARRLRFLFQGNLMFMWMFLSVLFMVGRAFFTRPTPYNTVASAYVGSLMITDDLEWVEYLELSFKNKKI
ncbi:hypothetical protein Y032_0076g1022 [Ancylostoma ceylanicum]|nr:hypothetical protein Y032_0076g1022 [Ancylostoma ceylanicum]